MPSSSADEAGGGMDRDWAYEAVSAFAQGLAEEGVTEVVISPGSRSTALALCLHAHPRLRTWIQIDERSAAFFALGQAKCTGRPSVLVCTSGTAAANYLPVVVEANHSGLPMIVCTADRPPEVRGWGAPQTIDQVGIYGSNTRWAIDLPVAGDMTTAQARLMATRAVETATGRNPGPVHLNWPLREPLEPLPTFPPPPDSASPIAPGSALPPDFASPHPLGSVPSSPPDSSLLIFPGSAPPPLPLLSPESALPHATTLSRVATSAENREGSSGGEAPPALDASALVDTGGVIELEKEFGERERELLAMIGGYERGVIIVGPDAGAGIEAQRRVVECALSISAATAWPIIGEPISGARRFDALSFKSGDGSEVQNASSTGSSSVGDSSPNFDEGSAASDEAILGARRGLEKGSGKVIAHASHLLSIEIIAEELRCDVVVRFGSVPTSKIVNRWLEKCRPAHFVLVDPANVWHDPSFLTTHHTTASAQEVAYAIGSQPLRQSSSYCQRWQELDHIAAKAITSKIKDGPLLSAEVVSLVANNLPNGSLVMTSNSLLVRDLDAYVGSDGPNIDFVGNRGANGIDGTISTALGLASQHHASPPHELSFPHDGLAVQRSGVVVLLVGDLAFLHDVGALFSAERCGLRLVVVCVDNNGGGIFAGLPIATSDHPIVSADTFDTLFRTPHDMDLAELDGVGGVTVKEVTTAAQLTANLAEACRQERFGVDVLLVRVDPVEDFAHRQSIASAVRSALK